MFTVPVPGIADFQHAAAVRADVRAVVVRPDRGVVRELGQSGCGVLRGRGDRRDADRCGGTDQGSGEDRTEKHGKTPC